MTFAAQVFPRRRSKFIRQPERAALVPMKRLFQYCSSRPAAIVPLEPPPKTRVDHPSLPSAAPVRRRSSGGTSCASESSGTAPAVDVSSAARDGHVTFADTSAAEKVNYFDVRLRTGGAPPQVYTLAVHEQLTVDDLHRQVAKLVDERAASIRLVYKAKVLGATSTAATVGSYGIAEDDVLQLVVVRARPISLCDPPPCQCVAHAASPLHTALPLTRTASHVRCLAAGERCGSNAMTTSPPCLGCHRSVAFSCSLRNTPHLSFTAINSSLRSRVMRRLPLRRHAGRQSEVEH